MIGESAPRLGVDAGPSVHPPQGPLPEPDTRLAIISTVIAGLGPLLFGLSLGFTGPTLTVLSVSSHDALFEDARFERIDDSGTVAIISQQGSMYSSIIGLGAMAGSVGGSYLCDVSGRKSTIMMTSVPFFICWLVTATSSDFDVLVAMRFFIGVCVGCVSMAVPLFISEVSPTHLRGALGAMNQLMVSLWQNNVE